MSTLNAQSTGTRRSRGLTHHTRPSATDRAMVNMRPGLTVVDNVLTTAQRTRLAALCDDRYTQGCDLQWEDSHRVLLHTGAMLVRFQDQWHWEPDPEIGTGMAVDDLNIIGDGAQTFLQALDVHDNPTALHHLSKPDGFRLDFGILRYIFEPSETIGPFAWHTDYSKCSGILVVQSPLLAGGMFALRHADMNTSHLPRSPTRWRTAPNRMIVFRDGGNQHRIEAMAVRPDNVTGPLFRDIILYTIY